MGGKARGRAGSSSEVLFGLQVRRAITAAQWRKTEPDSAVAELSVLHPLSHWQLQMERSWARSRISVLYDPAHPSSLCQILKLVSVCDRPVWSRLAPLRCLLSSLPSQSGLEPPCSPADLPADPEPSSRRRASQTPISRACLLRLITPPQSLKQLLEEEINTAPFYSSMEMEVEGKDLSSPEEQRWEFSDPRNSALESKDNAFARLFKDLLRTSKRSWSRYKKGGLRSCFGVRLERIGSFSGLGC